MQQIFWRTPLGAILQGIVLGLLTSLVALGIVLVYRSNRVLNFAQGELGLLPTILSVMLIVESGFPYLVALLLGLLAAITLGVSLLSRANCQHSKVSIVSEGLKTFKFGIDLKLVNCSIG